MDASKLRCPPFAPHDAKMIRSTRIRVGRNLAEFPLGPGITKQGRQQVEQKVVQACNSFKGELAGKYYSTAVTNSKRGRTARGLRARLWLSHSAYKLAARSALENVGC